MTITLTKAEAVILATGVSGGSRDEDELVAPVAAAAIAE